MKKWISTIILYLLGSLVVINVWGLEPPSTLLTSDNKLVQARSNQFSYGSRLQVLTSVDIPRYQIEHHVQVLEESQEIKSFDNLILFFKLNEDIDSSQMEVVVFDENLKQWKVLPYQRIENTLVVSVQKVGKFRIRKSDYTPPSVSHFHYLDILMFFLVIILLVGWWLIYHHIVVGSRNEEKGYFNL